MSEFTDHQAWFDMLLRWARTDVTDDNRGFTKGWLCRDESSNDGKLAEWQREYVRNISNARHRGISA